MRHRFINYLDKKTIKWIPIEVLYMDVCCLVTSTSKMVYSLKIETGSYGRSNIISRFHFCLILEDEEDVGDGRRILELVAIL